MHYKAAILGAIYLSLNLLYSMYLKRIALLDIMILVMGYYIRLLIGGQVANVVLSMWLLSLVTLIAVYLLLLKRRSDVLYFQEEGLVVRPTVRMLRTITHSIDQSNITGTDRLRIYGLSVTFNQRSAPIQLLDFADASAGGVCIGAI